MPVSERGMAIDTVCSFFLLSVKLVLLYLFLSCQNNYPLKITNLFQEDTDVHA